jgi:hypothetical protein
MNFVYIFIMAVVVLQVLAICINYARLDLSFTSESFMTKCFLSECFRRTSFQPEEVSKSGTKAVPFHGVAPTPVPTVAITNLIAAVSCQLPAGARGRLPYPISSPAEQSDKINDNMGLVFYFYASFLIAHIFYW